MSELTQELSALAGQWVLRPGSAHIPAGPPGVEIVTQNPLRWALLIGSNGIASAGAQPFSAWILPMQTIEDGFSCDGTNPLRFSYRTDGGLAQSAFWVQGLGAGNARAWWIEVVLQQ
jgi:hypothetical protein